MYKSNNKKNFLAKKNPKILKQCTIDLFEPKQKAYIIHPHLRDLDDINRNWPRSGNQTKKIKGPEQTYRRIRKNIYQNIMSLQYTPMAVKSAIQMSGLHVYFHL